MFNSKPIALVSGLMLLTGATIIALNQSMTALLWSSPLLVHGGLVFIANVLPDLRVAQGFTAYITHSSYYKVFAMFSVVYVGIGVLMFIGGWLTGFELGFAAAFALIVAASDGVIVYFNADDYLTQSVEDELASDYIESEYEH